MSGEAASMRLEGGLVTDSSDARLLGLFDAHHERLYRLARRLARTPDEARDLVQETFLRIVRAPASVPLGVSAEEAWLVRILVNVCRDDWRKRASRRRLDAQYQTPTWTLSTPNPETSLVAQTTVWRAMQALTPRRRTAIVLHELEGVSIGQIAHLLGVSAVTVRWHLSRGRRELERIINSQEESTS
jgi:RNA polymerase sigma-70 factor, ECF subfamily